MGEIGLEVSDVGGRVGLRRWKSARNPGSFPGPSTYQGRPNDLRNRRGYTLRHSRCCVAHIEAAPVRYRAVRG